MFMRHLVKFWNEISLSLFPIKKKTPAPSFLTISGVTLPVVVHPHMILGRDEKIKIKIKM